VGKTKTGEEERIMRETSPFVLGSNNRIIAFAGKEKKKRGVLGSFLL
jgi:hypothetical protein